MEKVRKMIEKAFYGMDEYFVNQMVDYYVIHLRECWECEEQGGLCEACYDELIDYAQDITNILR